MSNATILEQLDIEIVLKQLDKSYLEQLDEAIAAQRLGEAIFTIVMMIVGFMGNLLVLIIYAFRMKPSNSRTLILFLGAIDMCVTTLGMPFFIVRFFRPFTHATTVFCKMLYFLNYYFLAASSLVLLVIAVERYRKVCLPFRRQISRTLAKILCAAVLCVALIVAWPGATFVEIISINVGYTGSTINFCTMDETFWPFYQGFLLIYVIATFIVLAVLYALIWRAVKKSDNFAHPTGQSTTPVEMSSSNVNLGRINNHRHFRNRRRMATMFCLITVIFVVSYIPYTVVGICASAGVFHEISAVEITVLNFIDSIGYISSVTNCFVYSCFDVRFRCQIKALLDFCKTSPSRTEDQR